MKLKSEIKFNIKSLYSLFVIRISLLIMSVGFLAFSLGFAYTVVRGINQANPATTAGGFLNQQKIEEAANLLRDQTL